jgi:excisionase family DNA binding protein
MAILRLCLGTPRLLQDTYMEVRLIQTRSIKKAALVHWAANKLRVTPRTLYYLLAGGQVTEDEIRQAVVPWPGFFVSLGEAAEVCKRSEMTIRRWLKAGRFPYVQFGAGKLVRIPESLVNDMIAYSEKVGRRLRGPKPASPAYLQSADCQRRSGHEERPGL